jgi:hypothetical protein
VVASLTRRFGDLDVAEEAAAEASATAVERWPVDGVPPNPGAWPTVAAPARPPKSALSTALRASFSAMAPALFSSSQDGLALWDPVTGTRTGFTPGFTSERASCRSPTCPALRLALLGM